MQALPKPDLNVVSPEELAFMKGNISVLKLLNEQDPNYLKLVNLIKYMSNIKYDTSKKYELMYNVIKIGTLFELLLDKPLQDKVTGETFKTCDKGKINELSAEQQYAFFKVARNIVADSFHQLYEDKTTKFLEDFSGLCRGTNNYPTFAELKTYSDLVSKRADKFFSEDVVGVIRKEKIFCQMGYFILKAEELVSKGNSDGAIMAIVAAGTCGRHFNRSGLNEVKSGSICSKLYETRAKLSHSNTNEYNESKYLDYARDVVSKESAQKVVGQIKQEAEINVRKEVNLTAYYISREKSGTTPESPRAFDRNIYKPK